MAHGLILCVIAYGGLILIMLQTDRTISLPCGVNDIKSFTINSCDFYFLDRSGCRLIKWSSNVQPIETITLERKYLCICYDYREKCFWAIPECDSYMICRLDQCFCEVGHIRIKGGCQQNPISLCCNVCGNDLWICYPYQFARVEKCSEKTTWDKSKDSRKKNLAFIAQCECQVNCYYDGTRQIMELASLCNEESMELCIPKAYKVVGMAPCCGSNNCKKFQLYVLLSKGCSQELILMEYCIECSRGMIEPCCAEPCPPEPCLIKCPLDFHCGGEYEIMHSIALEEAGIAHILNAEGEKIQKAVACSNNIEELICVNESVKRTLTQVTLLEGMLYSKLEALVSYHDCNGTSKQESPCLNFCPAHACDDCHNCLDSDYRK